ncbi:hypothetical protein [Flavobacterium sp.]|uniref:hypothetical protein n=1 Tax=Flavobacterium sp. TaxID=239 RepID=UPI002CB55C54|nr:hypothetical protein [Flavobacterium sp.]HSD06244.1 hypothetical protein [Flavobacterium sp.]
MKIKIFIFSIVFLFSANSFSQKFEIGKRLIPDKQFKLLDFSPMTRVLTYQYIGPKESHLYNRKLGEILIGIQNGIIVTIVYNLIPEKEDEGVPNTTLESIQKKMSQPLIQFRYGCYAANIGNKTISLRRRYNSPLSLNKDRIMFFTTIKYSILMQ